MDIGILIYDDLEGLSGGYLFDRKLVEYLRSQGDRVEILSLPWRGYLRHLGDNLSLSLLRHLNDRDFDVLLQDELNHPSLFWLNRLLRSIHLARKASYPLISIVHHLRSSEKRPGWQNRLYRWVERGYLTSVDGFIFNSQATRRTVEELTGGGQPYVVAYPGKDHLKADISEREIRARVGEPGPLRVLFLGNLIPRKGLSVLLTAVGQLAPETCTLTVGGSLKADRRHAEALRQRASRQELKGRVRFLGYIRGQELSEQLRRHHILAVPSSYEGFGIVYLEAMGFGLPAIATTAGGAKEIITPGHNGYLISPGDSVETFRRDVETSQNVETLQRSVSTLAGHIKHLHQDRERLLAMSLAARRRYQTHPTWEQSCAKMRAFLHQWGRLTA